MRFSAVLICLLIVTIPIGIWIFSIAGKARLGIGREGFAMKWFTTAAYRWSDIESIQLSDLPTNAWGHGLVGAVARAAVVARTEGLKGPLFVKVRGKFDRVGIPAHQLQNSAEMAQEMERRTGFQILPAEG